MLARLVNWLDRRRARRRDRILAEPFPDAWLDVLARNATFYARLSESAQRQLRDNIQILVAEKQFVGCAGLKITDEIKVTVAANAGVLLLGLPHLDVYPRLREIIIYPKHLRDTTEAIGPDGRRYQIHHVRAGEAWRRGPVLLAWDSVKHSIARPHDGYNVILHEFAHVLDWQTGDADGVPPLESKEQYERWTRVFFDEFDDFVDADMRGRSIFIDPYGASHPAEFFAVATEHFFEQSRQLKRHRPRLFRLLADFYKQDPTQWR
ncbi:MAG: zinc-dependent peptidase [Phycisphaerae bacterium]